MCWGGVYSLADAQTYGATVNQQQAINNASKIQSLANISKAMDTSQNNKIDINRQNIDANEQNIGDNITKLGKITACNDNNKIYNPSSGDADGSGCVNVTPPIQQNNCEWVNAHCMNGHSCTVGARYTGSCAAGKYMAGFRLNTWGGYATYNHQIKCCSLY